MYKINIDIPKEMLELAKTAKEQNKPYDLCLLCPYMAKSCDGPNILAMEYPRWVEWANKRAKDLHLTREDIAEKSGLPVGTVSSALSGRTQDIRSETKRAITHVLIGGCWGQYPCHIAASILNGELEEAGDEAQEIQRLRERLQETEKAQKDLEVAKEQLSQRNYVSESDQRAIVFLKERVKFMEEELEEQKKDAKKKDKSIRRKEIVIVILFIVIAVILSAIIAVLIYDKMTPDDGWIRDTVNMLMEGSGDIPLGYV